MVTWLENKINNMSFFKYFFLIFKIILENLILSKTLYLWSNILLCVSFIVAISFLYYSINKTQKYFIPTAIFLWKSNISSLPHFNKSQ